MKPSTHPSILDAPPGVISLSTTRSIYEWDFLPLTDPGTQLRTPQQRDKAEQAGVTHVCVFAGDEPRWLKAAATAVGLQAVCLGYTRHRRHGHVTREVWGLAPVKK